MEPLLDKLWLILKIVLVALVLFVIGWVAIAANVNIGGWLSRLLGKKRGLPKAVLDDKENSVGQVSEIVPNPNPLRDKGVVQLDTGEKIQLPEGVKDTDVERVIRVEGESYAVTKKHHAVTDIYTQYRKPDDRGDDPATD